MTRDTRIFLIVCLVAFCASFVVQTLFQFLGAEKSVWGGNAGWQREIAFWNVACAVIVVLTLRLANQQFGLAVATGCTVLFLLLGVNHLFAFIANPGARFHWPPLLLNAIGLLSGIRLLLRRYASEPVDRAGV